MIVRNRVYRYWHKPIEWCVECGRYCALDREGKCPANHSIYARQAKARPVRYAVQKYGLPHPQTFTSHAQAANFLSEWHRRVKSWRDIARKLLGARGGGYHNGQVERTAVMLSAYARRESESREVCKLIGMKPPKRHRLHYEGGRGPEGQRRIERVRAWLKANEWSSLTEAVDEIMEQA